MARKIEFIKKSEARIIMYLLNAANHLKKGSAIGEKLDADYIYLMKLLNVMYKKGWVRTHIYNSTTYFDLTKDCPTFAARMRLIDEQVKLE